MNWFCTRMHTCMLQGSATRRSCSSAACRPLWSSTWPACSEHCIPLSSSLLAAGCHRTRTQPAAGELNEAQLEQRSLQATVEQHLASLQRMQAQQQALQVCCEACMQVLLGRCMQTGHMQTLWRKNEPQVHAC